MLVTRSRSPRGHVNTPAGAKHLAVKDREEEKLSLSEAISVDNSLKCDSPMKGGIRGVLVTNF